MGFRATDFGIIENIRITWLPISYEAVVPTR